MRQNVPAMRGKVGLMLSQSSWLGRKDIPGGLAIDYMTYKSLRKDVATNKPL